jgi:phenylacetate-CoA ligase
LQCLDDLSDFPFTTREDLEESGNMFLCVSQSEVERVVTVPMSPASGKPRRLFFTKEDLELTVDFFHHGMSTLMEPAQRAMILFPGSLPGSVGDLLDKALARMNVQGIIHGLVENPAVTLEEIARRKADCLVGIPTQVLSLARHTAAGRIPRGMIKSILLSADYVSPAIVHELETLWGCKVFNHYGTVEMGLGGGVECEALQGYHLREADLHFEIVDPFSGKPRAAGQAGEIVFTTLTRKGMPLIRYRTRDAAAFVAGNCPCGTVLKGLSRVRARLDEKVAVGLNHWVSITDLDDMLFDLSDVVDYRATMTRQDGQDRLEIAVCAGSGGDGRVLEAVRHAVAGVPPVRKAILEGSLAVAAHFADHSAPLITGAAKRRIIDLRRGHETL